VILSFLIASVILTLMPGPDILFVLAVSLERGTRQAVSVALGLCSGLIFHTTAVVCGVAVIIANSPVLFSVIKYLGVAYLTYLGVKTILGARRKNKKSDHPDPKEPEIGDLKGIETENSIEKELSATGGMTNWKFFKRGVTMNILNPKVALFFLSFLPGFIDPASGSPALDTVILGGVFAAQALVIFTLIAVAGSWLGRTMHIERYTGSMGFAIASACVYLALAIFIAI